MSESQKRSKLADLLFLGGTLSAAALLANYSPASESVPLRDGQAIHMVNESADELHKGAQAIENELKRQAREAELQCVTATEGEAKPIQIRGRYKAPRVPRRVKKASSSENLPHPAGGMRAPRKHSY